jgi:hypothetical protein
MKRFLPFGHGFLLPLILVCFGLASAHSSSRGDSNVINDEIINKWKSYELFARNLQGTARETTTVDSGKAEQRLLIYKQNRECVLNIISREQDSSEICRIGNPHYAASIKRSKANSNQVTLDKISQSPHGPFPGYAGDHVSVFDLTRSLISPHFTILTVPLSEVFFHPSFTVMRTLKTMEKGEERLQIDYKYLYNEAKLGVESTGRGSILLDPSRCWCIHRSKYSGTTKRKGTPVSDATEEIEFEIIDHLSGFPLVKTKTQNTNSYNYNIKKKRLSTRRVDYQWDVNDSVPNSEFTLSAFGLPEPIGTEPLNSSHTWLWLLVGALSAAALALLFVWLKHRHSRAIPPPAPSP